MLKGCQSPSQSVFLISEEKKIEYEEAVEFYERSGRTVLEWQVEILKHILAKNNDDLYVHTKFGYSVPRRNGKSEILGLREISGLLNGEKILHTAHRTSTSHNAWVTLCRMLNDAGMIDKAEKTKAEIAENGWTDKDFYYSTKANGLESVKMIATGGEIHFRTRTSKGGLGEGFDLLVIDEAQEYQDDQESSLKYTVSSSQNGQTIMCGTPPTAVSSGTVFVNFRNKCLEGGVKNGGWAEWSVDELTDCNDTEAWVRANPSLGYILTERAVEDEIGSDEMDFNIQRLGLWLKYNQKSAISADMWDSLKVSEKPKLISKLYVGIKFGKSGENIALSIAVKTESGQIFVETLFCNPVSQGINWIISFLQKVDYAEVVSDGKSGEQMLIELAKESKLKNIKFPTVSEVINANAVFEQAIFSQNICHNGQGTLRDVVTNCKKRAIGSNGGFGYESLINDLDISIMDSVIYAYWSAKNAKEKKVQKSSY